MISDTTAKKLHDKFSRGITLSPNDQKQLDEWYARQDTAESKALKRTSNENNTSLLRKQIDAALQQLTIAAKQLQQVAAENENLRRENGRLRRQLIEQTQTA